MRLVLVLLLLVSTCNQVENKDNLQVLTVVKVKPEKDGETVALKDEKGGKYTMIVSIPNLGENYIHLEVGDKVKVEGGYAESYPVQIFAKKITKVE